MKFLRHTILFLIVIVMLSSCTALTIDSAKELATKNKYYKALSVLDDVVKEETDNVELIDSYTTIFNNGKDHYIINQDNENLFLIEKLYLNLPNTVREKLPDIKVNVNEHDKRGIEIADNLFAKTKNLDENKYDEKIKKYRKYKEIFIYNKGNKKVEAELDRLNKKIEKTYSYNINGNDYDMISELEDNIFDKLVDNKFKYSNVNSDLKLEIEVNVLNYNPSDIKMQSFPKEYNESYVNENKKYSTRLVKYIENIYTNSTDIKVRLKYKLISNLSSEILFSGEQNFVKEYSEKWKTYYLISANVNKERFPKDQKEKKVPNKKVLEKEIVKEILKKINKEFHNLPVHKD